MTFDTTDFRPQANHWFEPTVAYTGWGRAEFSDPKGVVEGRVTVRFDEFGHSTVEMTAERGEFDGLATGTLFEALIGPRPKSGETQVVITEDNSWKLNPCRSLIVNSSDGVYRTLGVVHYDPSIHLINDEDDGTLGTLRFVPSASVFDTSQRGEPRYWVLPLADFLSDFRDRHTQLDRHPLRIFPTPAVPDDLPERELIYAKLAAQQHNKLIVFTFGESLAFIERLVDYDTRERDLEEGRLKSTITSIMVGDLGVRSIEPEEWKDWLSPDLLTVLSFANGSEITAPWIEFRDAGGDLVRRIHMSPPRHAYVPGRGAIRETIQRGTGHLLTGALSAPAFGTSLLRVTMKHSIRSGLSNLTLDDRFTHVVKGLDGLCNAVGLAKPNSAYSLLDRKWRIAVRSVIQGASKAIEGFAREAVQDGDENALMVLRKIQGRITGATQVTQGFGKNLVELLDHYDLADALVMDRSYVRKPGPGGRNWPDTLSLYRSTVIHNGFFDFQLGLYSIDDVYETMIHLRDILFRITLKLLAYDGKYQPVGTAWPIDSPLDWVNADTPLHRFGYQSSR